MTAKRWLEGVEKIQILFDLARQEKPLAHVLPLRAYLLAQCFILEELCHALRRLVHGSDWKTANAVFDLLLQTPPP